METKSYIRWFWVTNYLNYLKKQKQKKEINRKVYKQLLEMNIHLTTLNAAVSVITFGAPPYITQMRESMLNIRQDVEFSLNSIIQTDKLFR